jgi:hypothetical protein
LYIIAICHQYASSLYLVTSLVVRNVVCTSITLLGLWTHVLCCLRVLGVTLVSVGPIVLRRRRADLLQPAVLEGRQRRGRIDLVLSLCSGEWMLLTLLSMLSMDLARSVGAISPPSLLSCVYMTSSSTPRTGIGSCRCSIFFVAIELNRLWNVFMVPVSTLARPYSMFFMSHTRVSQIRNQSRADKYPQVVSVS